MGFLNQILEALLTQVVGPLVDKTGKGWKTVAGISLILLTVLAKMFAEWKGYESSTLDSVIEYAQGAAGVVFGVGVYHKVQKMRPDAVPVVAKKKLKQLKT